MKKKIALILTICFLSNCFVQAQCTNIDLQSLISIFNKTNSEKKSSILSLGFVLDKEYPDQKLTIYIRKCDINGKSYDQYMKVNEKYDDITFSTFNKNIYSSIKKELKKMKNIELLKKGEDDKNMKIDRYNYDKYKISFVPGDIDDYEIIIYLKDE